jgi:hypothetical protein
MGKAELLLIPLEVSVNGGVRPAGEAIELGTRKSSRFIGSGAGPLASSLSWFLGAIAMEVGDFSCGDLPKKTQKWPRRRLGVDE